ncbi:unnamed protein product [marine sediment metagenome]|uniref:Uncharacterized protein n=1 Tax=marine sediment metagenome TaxID=412755 RepID=X1UJR6_9ZZZZ
MKILLIALIIAILFLGFSIPWIIRTCARTRAEQIIYGRRPGTEKRINRCISILTWSNKWVTYYAHEDLIRIRKLNAMLEEMLHPHG